MVLWVKNLLASTGDVVQSLGQEDQLEDEMATHSSTLAWRIPWTEKLGVHGVGVATVGRDLVTKPTNTTKS